MPPIFDKRDYLYKLKHEPWKIPKMFISDLKCCHQRIVKGYCDRDVWCICGWFSSVMPAMLRDLGETARGFPVNFEGADIPSYAHQVVDLDRSSEGILMWKELLERMAFLFGEADEDTCQRKNPYQEEYDRINEAFWEEYGFLGEGLRTPEELEEERATGGIRAYSAGDLPENKELEEAYFREERAIDEYRNQCKNEAFEMLSRYFWDLWN